MKRKHLKLGTLALFIILCLSVGGAGSFLMGDHVKTWYHTLKMPALTPPDYIFGPVWTTLYVLMGISIWQIFKCSTKNVKKKKAYILFSIQLFLNLIWSGLFFGLQNPQLALLDNLILWIAIVLTIIEFHKHDELASYLLIPYLVWISFALYLNSAFVVIN
ncbi:MAG: tryptophan-rich sensory protein [Chlamydiae bacterium]|jgi:benzodiazapine receptor|nr:tryptophan-rich sensory protein [Chlamydiota bacterium]